MKRLLAMSLSVVLLLSALTSCAGEASPAAQSPPAASEDIFVDYIGLERLREDFTESVGVNFTQDFKMVYVQGGTFTLGWEGAVGSGPPDSAPIELPRGVSLSVIVVSISLSPTLPPGSVGDGGLRFLLERFVDFNPLFLNARQNRERRVVIVKGSPEKISTSLKGTEL
ncbi:MAG: hypothetical protein LBH17_06615 [Oscillospiraceae bacterium]|jgi:hypothetical protein|nr:hypothetical protein [Oscillospiraceae bacterium]